MITVLMPTYNNSDYIESAVRSMLLQTYGDFEFLIIDDSSTDNTAEKIKSFKDSRIRLMVNSVNIGLGRTLNLGLAEARHELVARMDGDDISLPGRLEKQLEFMKENADIDVLSCHYAMFSGKKILYVVKTNEYHNGIKKRLALHSEIIHPGVMYRKSKVLDNGGYRDSYIEDYELWLRLKDKVRFHNIQETLLLKRYHRNSISMDLEKKNKTVYSYTEKYFDNPADEFGLRSKEVNVIRGWREFFYGDAKKARYYFSRSGIKHFLAPRVIAGWIVSFLGSGVLLKIKEKRIRFRLIYMINYFRRDYIKIRKFLNSN